MSAVMESSLAIQIRLEVPGQPFVDLRSNSVGQVTLAAYCLNILSDLVPAKEMQECCSRVITFGMALGAMHS